MTGEEDDATGEDPRPFRDLARDLGVVGDGDPDSPAGSGAATEAEEPFADLVEALGLGERAEDAEELLVYRDSPDRRCFVCEEPLPETGQTLDGGEEYLIQRVNVEGEPYPLTERSFHPECWDEYRE